MKLKEWLRETEYQLLQGNMESLVQEVAYDSRKAEPGAVFVCIKGTRTDSHDFIPEVVEKGVRVLVIEKDLETLPEGVTVIRVAKGQKGTGTAFRSQIWLSHQKNGQHRRDGNQRKDHNDLYDQIHVGSTPGRK